MKVITPNYKDGSVLNLMGSIEIALGGKPKYNPLKILKPGENSYVGGKEGGVFIGLKKDMISRAERIAKR